MLETGSPHWIFFRDGSSIITEQVKSVEDVMRNTKIFDGVEGQTRNANKRIILLEHQEEGSLQRGAREIGSTQHQQV